jgi:glycolate oxidase
LCSWQNMASRRALYGRSTPLLAHRLTERYPERATESPYERSFYARDLAPIPGVMDRVFATTPDVVVRPDSAEVVADVLRQAAIDRVPVTTRAGASTALWGCVPVRGGILLDLSDLRGVVAIDPKEKTAGVRAGTVWTDFEHDLEGHHLAVKSLPSSAPASSVGGWLCTGGYGLGTLKYGRFLSQVRSAEVVLADGSIRRLTRESQPPLRWFEGSEGTLGVITELELEVRDALPMSHFLLSCPGISAVHEVITKLVASSPLPYSIHFDDRWTVAALDALGYAPAGAVEGREMVRVDWEGTPAELETAVSVTRVAVAAVPGVSQLSHKVAEEEWGERFRSLRIKRGGPSVLGQEVLLPLSGLAGYFADVERLARRYGVRLMSYGHMAVPDKVIVMTMFYADETKTMEYLLSLGIMKKFQDIAARRNGAPYGLAFWSTPHIRSRLADPTLDEWRRRKRELDPLGIMNPGKGPARLAVMNPTVVRFGMDALAGVARVARRGPA